MKTTSAQGRAMITQFEGNRLTAYQDAAGIWTIGVGHTPAFQGEAISQEQSDALLAADLADAEAAINKLVTVALDQNQFDSLVSLAFNIGNGAFEKSTLLRLLNEGDYAGAANQFLVWVKAAGKISQGLDVRRHAERKVFLYGYGPVPTEAA